MNAWRVIHVDDRKRVYLDGQQVQDRLTRLAILAAVDAAGQRAPVSGWVRQENGTWEYGTPRVGR